MLQTRLDQATSALVAFQQQQEHYHAMFLSFKAEVASLSAARTRLEDSVLQQKREVEYWRNKFDHERRRATSTPASVAPSTAAAAAAAAAAASTSPRPGASTSGSSSRGVSAIMSPVAAIATGGSVVTSISAPSGSSSELLSPRRSSCEKNLKDNKDPSSPRISSNNSSSNTSSAAAAAATASTATTTTTTAVANGSGSSATTLNLNLGLVSKDNRDLTSPRYRGSLSPTSPRSDDGYSPTTSPALSPREYEVYLCVCVRACAIHSAHSNEQTNAS